MRSDLMPTVLQRFRHIRVLFKSLADRICRDGHLVRFEQVEHAPNTNARPILVVAFGIDRTLSRPTRAIDLLPETAFRLAVSVQDGSLCSLVFRWSRQRSLGNSVKRLTSS